MNAPIGFDPHDDAYSTPIDWIDVSNPLLYQNDTQRLSPETQARKRAQRIAKPSFTCAIVPAQ